MTVLPVPTTGSVSLQIDLRLQICHVWYGILHSVLHVSCMMTAYDGST